MLQRPMTNSTGSSTSSYRQRLSINPLNPFRRRRTIRNTPSGEESGSTNASTHSGDRDSDRPPLHTRATETNSLHESSESNQRQLQTLVQCMRSAPSGPAPSHVDTAYDEFLKIREQASALCHAILQDDNRHLRGIPHGGDNAGRRDSSFDYARSPGSQFDQRSSFSGRSLAEVITTSGAKSAYANEPGLSSVRDWKICVETLAEAFRVSLAETYKRYERDATQQMVDNLFSNKRFRREAVNRMRNASVTRVMSADPQFFPRYEIRFRNYERVKQELIDIRHLLQCAESGISPARQIEEFAISSSGDAILEFANLTPNYASTEPALRFRVSSRLLAETSPIFARMFSGRSSSLYLHEDDNINTQLPPPPTKYTCRDGTEANLFRMPQHELNRLGCLEILLHAAHLHHDKIPKEVTFDQFIAIAECCIKYKSTAPLELMVEHEWLPHWMHQGADAMLDGLLVISYAFGLRQLFARTSKSVILNLAGEQDLLSKPWPDRIRDKIWAVRCAKVAQVYACCASAVQEYIGQPGSATNGATEENSLQNARRPSSTTPGLVLGGIPRCPKGSHACDAANLGWLMLVLNELKLLQHILRPEALGQSLAAPQESSMSLAQIIEALKKIPSPPAPVHTGDICNPCKMLKAAVSDIQNSLMGLTLHDVSGKSHGWALSKNKMMEPQNLLSEGFFGMAANEHNYSVLNEFDDAIRLQILEQLDRPEDLRSAILINRAFHATYQGHTVRLLQKVLQADYNMAISRDLFPLMLSNKEQKVLTQELHDLTTGDAASGADEAGDVRTVRSEDDDADSTDGDEDEDDRIEVDVTPVPPASGAPPPRQASPPRLEEEELLNGLRPPRQPMAESVHGPALAQPTSTAFADAISEEEPPMTEQEAHRILWPEAAIQAVSPTVPSTPSCPEESREKFLAGEVFFEGAVENKTLVRINEKQLQSDHEWRIGLIKKTDRPPTSRSGTSASRGDEGGD
ncbi:hypothetical protein S7711_05772 [Stachybotrys chartarum IBT 7711]|uniref:BTB domain-containing protein n=1 Tax=Stachybotrys chartarum (strain CBS 109288 / IBT 7711) TaxID=1280523 RepID=A0A084ATF9_STACB|nr:hypothetical protein S7711_05772 [Stachybotrys chartarum IBT 7711]KFA51197.1 hypothetical protein S40293_05102 [Stachybotrys chartarum IBT 40293]